MKSELPTDISELDLYGHVVDELRQKFTEEGVGSEVCCIWLSNLVVFQAALRVLGDNTGIDKYVHLREVVRRNPKERTADGQVIAVFTYGRNELGKKFDSMLAEEISEVL